MERKKTACVTGNRPNKFPWQYCSAEHASAQKKYLERIQSEIKSAITKDNITDFISGGALGVDMDFGEAVLEIKKDYPKITLEIAVPCNNQDKTFSKNDKERYKRLLKNADSVTRVSHVYFTGCMQKRNEYMVNKSDLVIAFWNGEKKGGTYNTLRLAKQKEKALKLNNLNDFLGGNFFT